MSAQKRWKHYYRQIIDGMILPDYIQYQRDDMHAIRREAALERKLEAAEARSADLSESNREQAEEITTLRAERDEQATRIIELEATTAAYKIGNDELKRIIDTLRSERNEAWSSLKDAYRE